MQPWDQSSHITVSPSPLPTASIFTNRHFLDHFFVRLCDFSLLQICLAEICDENNCLSSSLYNCTALGGLIWDVTMFLLPWHASVAACADNLAELNCLCRGCRQLKTHLVASSFLSASVSDPLLPGIFLILSFDEHYSVCQAAILNKSCHCWEANPLVLHFTMLF